MSAYADDDDCLTDDERAWLILRENENDSKDGLYKDKWVEMLRPSLRKNYFEAVRIIRRLEGFGIVYRSCDGYYKTRPWF